MNKDYEVAKLKLAGIIFAVIFVIIQIYSIIFVNSQINGINRFQRMRMAPIEFAEAARLQREEVYNLALLAQVGLSILGAIASYIFADYALKPVKESVEKQRRFLAYASHELKTPVATLSLLAESEDKSISKDFKEEIEKLTLSIDKYLDLLRNNHQKVNLIKVKLDDVISESLKKSESKYKFKELEIDYKKINEEVKTDKDILNSIMRNIIENAIKYSPNKGEVKIIVQKIKETNEVVIEVINNFVETQSGYGIGHEIVNNYSKLISAKFEFTKDEETAYSKIILPSNLYS